MHTDQRDNVPIVGRSGGYQIRKAVTQFVIGGEQEQMEKAKAIDLAGEANVPPYMSLSTSKN